MAILYPFSHRLEGGKKLLNLSTNQRDANQRDANQRDVLFGRSVPSKEPSHRWNRPHYCNSMSNMALTSSSLITLLVFLLDFLSSASDFCAIAFDTRSSIFALRKTKKSAGFSSSSYLHGKANYYTITATSRAFRLIWNKMRGKVH